MRFGKTCYNFTYKIMSKYKNHFKTMLEENQDLFNAFKEIQDNYAQDPNSFKNQFDREGTKIMRVIRRYENALCSRSENSGFGKYSESLSEKFWGEVRTYLPHIDEVTLQ